MAKRASRAEIGRRIRQQRRDLGLSMSELGESVDTDKASISRLERGLSGLSVDRLQRIADALKLDPSDLLRHGTQ